MMKSTAAVLTLLLAGCMPPKPNVPERYFVLAPLPATAGAHYAGAPVIVAPTGAASFYGSTQIVYSDSPGTRSRYRYSFWIEPPQAVLEAQLASRLQGMGGAPAWLLQTRIDELFHDAGTAPGVARLTVTARLASLPGQVSVAQRTISRAVPVTSFDAPGAVTAMRLALGAVVDDIVAWVAAQANSPPYSTLDPLRVGAQRSRIVALSKIERLRGWPWMREPAWHAATKLARR